MNKPIYVGVDGLEQIRLYLIEDGKPRALTRAEWISLLDAKGLRPGDMQPIKLGAEDENEGWIPVGRMLPKPDVKLLIYSEGRYGARQGEYTDSGIFVDVFGNPAGGVIFWKYIISPK
jgi:hypothetical protein